MAITRLIRIKERKSGDPSGGLKSALCYICNPKKSGWIGGFSGPTPERAYEVMKRNKEYWNKTGGSAGFHYVISFPPESGIDVKTAASVAEDFAQELLGGKYYYMYSVHTDKAHLHVHVVFDSVGIEDGVKYHSPRGDWEKRIQPITDKVCKKYGLPPLEYGEAKTSVDYGEWRERKKRQEDPCVPFQKRHPPGEPRAGQVFLRRPDSRRPAFNGRELRLRRGLRHYRDGIAGAGPHFRDLGGLYHCDHGF